MLKRSWPPPMCGGPYRERQIDAVGTEDAEPRLVFGDFGIDNQAVEVEDDCLERSGHVGSQPAAEGYAVELDICGVGVVVDHHLDALEDDVCDEVRRAREDGDADVVVSASEQRRLNGEFGPREDVPSSAVTSDVARGPIKGRRRSG